ncbi:MAG: Rieske 2Fe-2S domain-containing protein [Deltaproteobacteria bacterium]|nr:Rieske 2Fe-2S domain-containing protein [Deltaproteobacteria bacterium]MCZ6547537.1 Rieske 2Fe-2S domain-containing protein [Deltaproteobacteria bacterium]MCZ6562232.1 Rieske 2Fe-2S domain-containing protein [Deltaproteobacteria bacterium]MCZ6906848.1 Rieske 2Fe-2S domain-containing protein [Deltaproteobacteria bacterium]
MPRKHITSEDVNTLLARGLRNKWYAICPSRFVTDRPVGLQRVGERLVLWRERNGMLHVQEDHCPHRGAPLSLARHLGDRLACIYHGFEVKGDGTVASVPAMLSSKLVGKKLVKTYPAMEVKDGIFAYIGDALHPKPVPFTPAEQLTSDEFDAFLCYTEWKVPLRYAVDNIMDPMHGAFLHAESHSMAQGEKQAKFQIRKTEQGFIFEKEGQRDLNFDWVEWCDTGGFWMRLEIPYSKSSGPGGSFGIIAHGTPIDNETCAVFFWRFRKVQGWQRDVWRFLYKNRLEGYHWDVLEQDQRLLESMPHDADQHEHLYQHDAGLAGVRRTLRKEAKAQLEELAAAGKLPKTIK